MGVRRTSGGSATLHGAEPSGPSGTRRWTLSGVGDGQAIPRAKGPLALDPDRSSPSRWPGQEQPAVAEPAQSQPRRAHRPADPTADEGISAPVAARRTAAVTATRTAEPRGAIAATPASAMAARSDASRGYDPARAASIRPSALPRRGERPSATASMPATPAGETEPGRRRGSDQIAGTSRSRTRKIRTRTRQGHSARAANERRPVPRTLKPSRSGRGPHRGTTLM